MPEDLSREAVRVSYLPIMQLQTQALEGLPMAKTRTKNTIYDVARHAGVAISTVSRVLNNSADVSEPTRLRVLRAIDELQFRPDRTAKMLANKQTVTLAVATPTFTSPFHNELLKGIRNRLRERDVDLLLCDLGSSGHSLRLLNFLKRGAVDGLLLVGVPVDGRLAQELSALHAPVILIGSRHDDFDSYFWDDVAGARVAVEHLIESGHTRIGLLASHAKSPVQQDRVEGYRAALQGAGIAFDLELVKTGRTEKHGGFSEEAGYEAMTELLTIEPRVTAVFASSDVQALGAWKAVRDAGLSVPTDVAVVGYDDIKTSRYIGLTSVDQGMQRVAEEATEVLLARVEHGEDAEPVSHRIVPRLNVRDSSKKS